MRLSAKISNNGLVFLGQYGETSGQIRCHKGVFVKNSGLISATALIFGRWTQRVVRKKRVLQKWPFLHHREFIFDG